MLAVSFLTLTMAYSGSSPDKQSLGRCLNLIKCGPRSLMNSCQGLASYRRSQ